MKCAMELMEIGATKAMRIAEERAMAKYKAVEKQRLRKERMIAYTKQWCEQVVAPMLEEYASRGNVRPMCNLWFSGNNKSTVVQYLEPTESNYADNRHEACSASEDIHIPTLKEYLAQFCYNLKPIGHNDYWIYWSGKQEGYNWEVTVSPSCIQ